MNARRESRLSSTNGATDATTRRIVWSIYTTVFALFILALGTTAWVGIGAYQHASAILDDHTVAVADLKLVRETLKHRRGRNNVFYEFDYTYNASGQRYTGRFIAPNPKADQYLGAGTIAIVYANDNPRLSGVRGQFEADGSLLSLVKRLLAVTAVCSFFALLLISYLLSRFAPTALLGRDEVGVGMAV